MSRKTLIALAAGLALGAASLTTAAMATPRGGWGGRGHVSGGGGGGHSFGHGAPRFGGASTGGMHVGSGRGGFGQSTGRGGMHGWPGRGGTPVAGIPRPSPGPSRPPGSGTWHGGHHQSGPHHRWRHHRYSPFFGFGAGFGYPYYSSYGYDDTYQDTDDECFKLKRVWRDGQYRWVRIDVCQ